MKDCANITPNQGIRPFVAGARKCYSNYSDFIKKKDETIPKISCLVHTIRRIFEIIIEHSILKKLNKKHHKLNNAGVFLPILFSHGLIYQSLDYKTLHVATTIVGRKL